MIRCHPKQGGDMPLDSGLLAILDDRGRGAARANALDVVIDDAAPQARLQRLLDLIWNNS